jgi:hypothetical protein
VKKLRLFLILLLSIALDFSSPVMPLGMESGEEFEEQAHRARARRVVRLTRETSGPVAPQVPLIGAPRASVVRAMSVRHAGAETGVRKTPSALGDSPSSSPEDQ